MSSQVVALRKEFGKTVAADIAYRMREEIISCRLPPGEPLKFEMLRGTFGASFSTLREALMDLAADGLVVGEGQRGFRVAPVSAEDLMDITNARVLIEVDAFRKSIAFGGDEWEIASMSTLHRLSKIEERIDGRPSDDPECAGRTASSITRSLAPANRRLCSRCAHSSSIGRRDIAVCSRATAP